MLIVLEGLDGAGKSTQIKKLTALFEARGAECAYLHFPRFDAPIYGDLIARFLRGESEIPMRRHRVLAVTCADGSRWIVDAGIGQAAFRRPLPLS